jgi:phenylacetate-coenzyme A ligase PaaK-like adenylate-forming protein
LPALTHEPSEQDVYARFAAKLRRTERMPRSGLDAYRDGLLARLVTFAHAHSPFYRDRLAPLFRGTEKPDLRAWRDVPILRRADLERDLDRMSPAQPPPEIGAVSTRQTSGTTGTSRLSFRTCALVRIADACMMQRLYRWWDYDDAAPMASIRHYAANDRGFPDGKIEMQWSYPGRQAPHYMLDLRTSTDNMIAWLVRHRPKYLLTFPSVLQELASHPDAGRIADLGLRGIVAISEIAGDDIATLARKTFGCNTAQIYGCAEAGAIALQSPQDGALAVCEENVMVELLDDDDRPVEPGQTGRVILTSLHNYATPFIRYEIGDYATLAEDACPTGGTLTRLARVEGRRRNALMSARGEQRIWQRDVPAACILRHVPARQFQIRQDAQDTIELLFVPTGAAPADHAGLTNYFSGLLGRPITLTLTAVDTIARTAGGKHERIVSSAAA